MAKVLRRVLRARVGNYGHVTFGADASLGPP